HRLLADAYEAIAVSRAVQREEVLPLEPRRRRDPGQDAEGDREGPQGGREGDRARLDPRTAQEHGDPDLLLPGRAAVAELFVLEEGLAVVAREGQDGRRAASGLELAPPGSALLVERVHARVVER